MTRKIFRKSALERLASPEQLDLLLQVTSPKSWLVLLALGSLVVVGIMWSFMGTIPTEVSSPVILLNTGGVKNIISLHSGQVVELYVQEEDIVTQGQLIAEITPIGQTNILQVTSPYSGAEVLELKIGVGSLVNQGQSLASLEFSGEAVDLEAVLYLSPAEGKNVQPGMEVKIAPVTVKPEEFGYLLGQVASVADFPATQEGMLVTLGSEELIETLVTEPAPIEVKISLLPEKTTASGYKWSSSTGPDFELNSGTPGVATITINKQRPIELILPIN